MDLNHLKTTRLYICITSRPEIPIRLGFRAMPGILYRDLILHDIPRVIVDQDISVFREKFKELRDIFEDLASDWPGDENINLLVQRAEGLFIYAATVCRFVMGDEQWPPQDLLKMFLPSDGSDLPHILKHNIPLASPTWELDEMYSQILHHSLRQVQRNIDDVAKLFKQVVGSLVILSEPLSASALARLLDLPIERINLRVRRLHSVLNIPKDHAGPIRLLHPSFREFLLDNKRCSDFQFWIDERQTHWSLAVNCIQLMSKCLRQDICEVGAPGTLVANMQQSVVKKFLPPEVQYACLYWIQHLQKSSAELYDSDEVYQFLQNHLLHWLEALAWMRRTSEGILAILSLEAQISVSRLNNILRES
jgi:hypothetical protein